MKAHLLKTTLMLGLALATLSTARAETLFSEGFENPTAGAPDTTTPSGWVYSSGNDSIARASGLTDTEAYAGNQSMEFDFSGTQYTGNGSSEYDEYYDQTQTVSLSAGDTLTLTFYARTDTADTLGGGALGVLVAAGYDNGNFVNQNLEFVSSSSVSANGWTEFSDSFTAASAIDEMHYTLKMATTGSDATGALFLDNFSESASGPNVPEPATWALLVGGVGLLAGWRRLARKSAAARG